MSAEVNEYCHPTWEERWANGIAPGQSFDATTPSPLLVQYVQDGLIPNGRALVPGCGRGYDVTLLASEHRVAIGLEISPTAVTAAEDRLKNLPDEEFPHKSNALFQLANFFDLPAENEAEKFDFIYDYTFFCALNPKIRIDWANQMSRLVKKGGLLLTLIFPINAAHHGGPPFAVTMDIYKELLESVGFEMVELRLLPPELCHSGRDGSEGSWGFSAVGRWRKI